MPLTNLPHIFFVNNAANDDAFIDGFAELDFPSSISMDQAWIWDSIFDVEAWN
jgi:hypothetical protein